MSVFFMVSANIIIPIGAVWFTFSVLCVGEEINFNYIKVWQEKVKQVTGVIKL